MPDLPPSAFANAQPCPLCHRRWIDPTREHPVTHCGACAANPPREVR
jgi:hypothetical protein